MTQRSPEDERDDGWAYSTEGDLDPDLTEEVGYRWEPPQRAWLPVVMRVAFGLALAAMVLGTLLTFR